MKKLALVLITVFAFSAVAFAEEGKTEATTPAAAEKSEPAKTETPAKAEKPAHHAGKKAHHAKAGKKHHEAPAKAEGAGESEAK